MRLSSFRIPVLGFAVIVSGCGGNAPRRQELPLQTVSVVRVAPHEITGGLIASGRLVPREEVGVAADLPGYRIAHVAVEEGARVRKGEVLATLDDSLILSQIDQMRAMLAQQQIAAEQAQEQAARTVGLKGQGVLSDEAIRNRDLAARSAQATVAATRAQLNDLLVRHSHMTIRAPAAGIVLELYAELPEADVAHVALGDPADVTLASGKRFAGTVRLIGERVDSQTGLVTVRIALPISPDLRNGGFAQARFDRKATVIAVPEAAIRFDADGASVTVVGHDDRVHKQRVRTGQRSGGLVEILQGPPSGTTIAVKGAAFVLDGDKVRIAGAAR